MNITMKTKKNERYYAVYFTVVPFYSIYYHQPGQEGTHVAKMEDTVCGKDKLPLECSHAKYVDQIVPSGTLYGWLIEAVQSLEDGSRWPSRPIRSLRYIVTCTIIRALQES